MKYSMVFLIVAVLCGVVYALDPSTAAHGNTILKLVNKVGGDIFKKTIKNFGLTIARGGALSFLTNAEVESFKEMLEEMEFEKLQEEAKNKLMMASIMMNATSDIYNRQYQCTVGDNYIGLTFMLGKPNTVLPEKWILKFFN